MARPLSEAKRDAIVTAATELIAAVGTGASTASMAKAAGVSEGALFTYFATKDELLNQLFVEIKTHLAQTMLASHAAKGAPRERIRQVWNHLIDWGARHPARRKALRHLDASDRITEESRRHCNALFRQSREIVEKDLVGHMDPMRMHFYLEVVLMGLADITIDAMAVAPKRQHEHLRQAGFDLFWKGSAA